MAKNNEKKNSDPQDVINTATGAAGGIPKRVVDAGTKPKPKSPTEGTPTPPDTGVAGGTPDIGKKKKN